MFLASRASSLTYCSSDYPRPAGTIGKLPRLHRTFTEIALARVLHGLDRLSTQ